MQPSIITDSSGELAQLRHKIRWGEEPDNPLLITYWLAHENQLAEPSRELLRQRYESQFILLLETVVDELVIAQWRCLCLDNIYRPLQSLKHISDSARSDNQIQRLIRELAMQSRYVRHSLCF
ncbi:MAG: hypothetical protein AAGC78_00485 [Cellvibrio sp.]|uniref:hypothetical protein n=1 Tax=Cellvibrio sp. TaxID=1965322 RepID=UPI0031A04C3E